MHELNNVDIKDFPKNAKMCFVGYNDDVKDFDKFKDLICYFTTSTISKDVWGDGWDCCYRVKNVPNITNDNKNNFYIVHIKNFLVEEFFGIESYTYQKDNWKTIIDDFRLNITPKMINSGFGGWLYKETSSKKCDAITLGSDTTFSKFMKHFKKYELKFYKY